MKSIVWISGKTILVNKIAQFIEIPKWISTKSFTTNKQENKTIRINFHCEKKTFQSKVIIIIHWLGRKIFGLFFFLFNFCSFPTFPTIERPRRDFSNFAASYSPPLMCAWAHVVSEGWGKWFCDINSHRREHKKSHKWFFFPDNAWTRNKRGKLDVKPLKKVSKRK